MFGFERNNEIATEIKRLRSLLEKNPEDSKSRLTLAGFYLKAGDQETAVKEYHASAKQLGAEGLDLESIAIYKRILSLDGISLTRGSLASVEEAEELLAKAREAYEEVFQTEHRDDTAKEAAEAHCRDRIETEKDREKTETPSGDDSEPVFTEMPQMSSQDQEGPEMPPCENPEEDFPDLEPSDGLGECDSDGSGQEPFEPLDESLGEGRSEDTVHETDITLETDSSYPRRDRQIDRNDIQIDDDLEAMLSDDESEPDPREESSQPDTTETLLERSDQEDPDLHYNLGVAYYEMDLVDKAIKEFTEAHDRGVKTVEILSMLAKCYYEKGLFQNARGLTDQALKLDNLTQDQVDMLLAQLEKIKAKTN